MRIGFFDPGATGALAVLDTVTKRHSVHDIPQMVTGKRTHPNPFELGGLLREMQLDVVGIEWVVPMSTKRGKDGVRRDLGIASTGHFMYGAGVLLGVCGALGLAVEFVTPAEWKRYFRLLGMSKEASRSLALRKFPKLASELKRKKDSDRAEALLMALWLWQTKTETRERLPHKHVDRAVALM